MSTSDSRYVFEDIVSCKSPLASSLYHEHVPRLHEDVTSRELLCVSHRLHRSSHHQRKQRSPNLGSDQDRRLTGVIVDGRDLDDVGADNREIAQPVEDGQQLAGGPPARLGGARRRSESRVHHVDVDGDVDLGASDALLDLGDDAGGAKPVEVAGRDDVEAAALVVSDVAFLADQRGAYAGVD